MTNFLTAKYTGPKRELREWTNYESPRPPTIQMSTFHSNCDMRWDSSWNAAYIPGVSQDLVVRRFLVRANVAIDNDPTWRTGDKVEISIDTVYPTGDRLRPGDFDVKRHARVTYDGSWAISSGRDAADIKYYNMTFFKTVTIFSLQEITVGRATPVYIQLSSDRRSENTHYYLGSNRSTQSEKFLGLTNITLIELARGNPPTIEEPEVGAPDGPSSPSDLERAAASITPEQVKNVIVGTVLTKEQIEGCISTATIVVLDHLLGKGLTVRSITEITLYLAAHFVSLRDRSTRIKKERIGDAEVEYEASKSPTSYLSFASTEWGATALTLDSSGTLASLGQSQPRLINL